MTTYQISNKTARLIAAAPDLLKALKGSLEHCAPCRGRGHVRIVLGAADPVWTPCSACAPARAAIAKAEGGA